MGAASLKARPRDRDPESPDDDTDNDVNTPTSRQQRHAVNSRPHAHSTQSPPRDPCRLKDSLDKATAPSFAQQTPRRSQGDASVCLFMRPEIPFPTARGRRMLPARMGNVEPSTVEPRQAP